MSVVSKHQKRRPLGMEGAPAQGMGGNFGVSGEGNNPPAHFTQRPLRRGGMRDAAPRRRGHNAMLCVALFPAERGRATESLSRPE